MSERSERREHLTAIAQQLFETLVERTGDKPGDVMAVLLFMVWHWQVGFVGDDEDSKQEVRARNLMRFIGAIKSIDLDDDGVRPGTTH